MEGFEEENCDRILFSEASVSCSARLNSENESAAGPPQQNEDNRRINLEWQGFICKNGLLLVKNLIFCETFLS